MAAEIGPPDPALKPERAGLDDLLFREGFRFEFFQAVRLLERLYPDRQPVGRFARPQDEVVRFRAHPSMATPASQIYEISAERREPTPAPPSMVVTFMGLAAGSLGALPLQYTQLLTDSTARAQTAALRDFLDIFNHRFISLFYRAWEKYRFPIAYERGGEDAFSQDVYCLVGMGTSGLQRQLGVSDEILLYYAGHFSHRPRAAASLEGLLEDYFGVPVTVEQFTGEWFLMNVDALTSLGGNGANNQLGVNTTLWERVWDPQARFRIKLGPLAYEQFLDFMPTSDGYRHVVELTRFFVGEELSFEVQPILRASDVPACALGSHPNVRLGWGMWLKTEPFTEDTSQPVFAARVAQPLEESAA